MSASKIINRGWVGVDLDGTLAHYDSSRGIDHIGDPIPKMAERVREWLKLGWDVRIFTARVHPSSAVANNRSMDEIKANINEWCLQHFGMLFIITCEKDMGMIALYDDRCVQIISNTGIRADGQS